MGWTKDRDMLLIRLCSEGASIHAIAKALGTSKSATHTRLSRLRACGFQVPKPQNIVTLANLSSAQAVRETSGKVRQTNARECAAPVMPTPSRGNGTAPVPALFSDLAPPTSSAAPVAFVTLRPDQCRYPLWPDHENPPIASKMACGAPTSVGISWCPICLVKVHRKALEAETMMR